MENSEKVSFRDLIFFRQRIFELRRSESSLSVQCIRLKEEVESLAGAKAAYEAEIAALSFERDELLTNYNAEQALTAALSQQLAEAKDWGVATSGRLTEVERRAADMLIDLNNRCSVLEAELLDERAGTKRLSIDLNDARVALDLARNDLDAALTSNVALTAERNELTSTVEQAADAARKQTAERDELALTLQQATEAARQQAAERDELALTSQQATEAARQQAAERDKLALTLQQATDAAKQQAAERDELVIALHQADESARLHTAELVRVRAELNDLVDVLRRKEDEIDRLTRQIPRENPVLPATQDAPLAETQPPAPPNFRSTGSHVRKDFGPGTLNIESPVKMIGRVNQACTLGAFSYIQDYTEIENATIGRFCSIAKNVVIGPGEHPVDWLSTHPFVNDPGDHVMGVSDVFPAYKALLGSGHERIFGQTKVEIGNDVWIGQNAIILSGAIIGDGAIVAAGAVVKGVVEPYAIVGGVPARLIRHRFDTATCQRLLEVKFWNYDLSPLRDRIDYSNVAASLDILEAAIANGELSKLSPSRFLLTKESVLPIS